MGLFSSSKSSTSVTTNETNYNIQPETRVDVPISVPPPDYSELAEALKTVGLSLAGTQAEVAKAAAEGSESIGGALRDSVKYAAIAIAAVLLLRSAYSSG